jgi:hypothetical protein
MKNRVIVVGRCIECGREILSSEKWVQLHGYLFCCNEAYSRITFDVETKLANLPINDLRNSGNSSKLQIQKKKLV